jgi:type I restriction enzyme R subunit
LNDLRETMRRPPWLLQPPDIWRAYKRLSADRVRGNPAGTRYAIGESEELVPLPALVAGRFNLSLGREEKAAASIPTSRGRGSRRSATISQ